jgi:hypothetical protein
MMSCGSPWPNRPPSCAAASPPVGESAVQLASAICGSKKILENSALGSWNVSGDRYYVRVGKIPVMIIRKEGRFMDERELPGSDPVPESTEGLPDPRFGPDVQGLPDPEWDAYLAWREREIAAGRDEEPPEPWEVEGPAVSLSLGDATDIDPALLFAICGPDGLDSDALGPQFGQDAAADMLRPGPVLTALTEQASADLSRLTDNQLIGALHAARRLENRANYLQTRTIAEFARRRSEEFETAKARGVRVGCRAGEFPGVELASELLISRVAAGRWIESAADLTTRLPSTLQGMSTGLIDAERAGIIAAYTACLSPEDAAKADEILASAAPEIRADSLARRAATLEMKLDPVAAKTRKERTKRIAQRVEVQLERSGNASVAGRELDIADATASKANIHAIALRLRRGGLEGNLDHLRATVFNDLLQGRNPFDRLAPIPEAPAEDDVPAEDQTSADEPTAEADQKPADGPVLPDDLSLQDPPIPECPTDDPPDGPPAEEYEDGIGIWPRSGDDHSPDDEDPGYDDASVTASDPAGAGVPARAPMPAVINLLVPAGTLFGWDTTPSRASGWGLLNPYETRDVVRAASLHPQTRWCMTVVGADGTAVAHGCSPGQHPWSPTAAIEPEAPPHPSPPQPPPDGPDARQAAQLAHLMGALKIALEPIAKGTCDHGHTEDHYTPSRKLQHLVRARTATCTAPGCQAEAIHADLDHTIPHPEGPTDECNLGPKCRTHHRAKQAPGWKVEQPEPGVFRWILPSGRTHTTRPTTY